MVNVLRMALEPTRLQAADLLLFPWWWVRLSAYPVLLLLPLWSVWALRKVLVVCFLLLNTSSM